MDIDCDKREWLLERCDTLAGLHDIANARHRAGYENGLRMTNYCINGQFSTDTCGNFSRMQIAYDDGDSSVVAKFPDVPPVVTYDELFEFIKSKGGDHRTSISSFSGRCLPSPGDYCHVCGRRFNVANAYYSKFHEIEGVAHWYHQDCFTIFINRKQTDDLYHCFARARVQPYSMVPVENQYWKDRSAQESWYRVSAKEGVFLVGWRKRVIHLEIESPTSMNFEEMFESEKVTVDRTSVHCWGYEKLEEYLKKIKAESQPLLQKS